MYNLNPCTKYIKDFIMALPGIWLAIWALKSILTYLYFPKDRKEFIDLLDRVKSIVENKTDGKTKENLLKKIQVFEDKIPEEGSIDNLRDDFKELINSLIKILETKTKKVTSFIFKKRRKNEDK